VLTANPGTISAAGSTPAHPAAFINWTGGPGCTGTSPTIHVTTGATALSCTAHFQ
jgi:hypothetical protein